MPKYNIILEVSDQFKEDCLPMLEYIKKIAGYGHSFSIMVDPDNSEYEKEFYVDGDGASHIHSIKVEEVKE